MIHPIFHLSSQSRFGLLAIGFWSFSMTMWGQQWGASPADMRQSVADQRALLAQNAWTDGLALDNIGPGVMGGRVVDLATVGDTVYVAYATGGLWKSVNHGTTFTPLLQATTLLGAVAAHPSGRVVVGSGEVNSSRSSYAGDGVYISDDFGQTWRHAGLAQTHHIGRIVIDPIDPDRMWVAALGELYSDNFGGGVYHSKDGGNSWDRVLNVPGGTKGTVVGAVDLVMEEGQPNHLYAATWDRTRRAHEFTESGAGSGVWESMDGGENWTRITSSNAFPEGPDAGRIGLGLHSGSGTLYALVDNQARRPADAGDNATATATANDGLNKEDFLDMDRDTFLQLDPSTLQDFLDANDFAASDSAQSVLQRVAQKELTPRALYDHLTDGNAALFDTEIIGPELYVYQDQKWTRTHENWLDNVCYTYGYYFGVVSVDPTDAQTVYIAGVPLLKSTDGGRTFSSIGAENVHVDHHKLWIDPNNPSHLMNGNDGGLNVSWDGGQSWVKCNSPSVGQFYAVAVDQQSPYNVYGGLQDNGTWVGPHTHRESKRWLQTGHHPYVSLGGGDGMQIAVDSRHPEVVYTGYQFGWYQRTNRTTGERTGLHPRHNLGDPPLRWNWQTPILLSQHQEDVLYMGSNKLHRSLNRGDNWETLGPDLTRGPLEGNVPFGTLTTLAEHPKRFGQLAAGSDDGLVHITKDGGHNWTRLDLPIPTSIGKGDDKKHLWVTEVSWSHHDANLLVVALNGYRHDAMDAWVFATRDEGKSWERWGADLPAEPVNALVESADMPGWWMVGTDGGAYLTLDAGGHFAPVHKDLPRVPVHDLVIQEKEDDLILGTHGRGIYRLDLSPIMNISDFSAAQEDLFFQKSEHEMTWSEDWGSQGWGWGEPWEPTAEMWLHAPFTGPAKWQLRRVPAPLVLSDSSVAESGGASRILDQLQTREDAFWDLGNLELTQGPQALRLDMRQEDGFLEPGRYNVVVHVGTPSEVDFQEATTTLVISE